MLESVVTAAIKARETLSLDLAQPSAEIALVIAQAFANGSGAGQADRVWSDTRQLAAGASETLDLTGALTSVFSGPLVLAGVKALLIRARPANTDVLAIGPAASAGFLGPFISASDRLRLPPGGVLLAATPRLGWAVADGADGLSVANPGADIATYDLILLGQSEAAAPSLDFTLADNSQFVAVLIL